jgi:RNA polymerase sigma factor (sigma-70 family)
VVTPFQKGRPAGLSEQAFLALYRERWEELLRFFVRRVLVAEVAADLVAEVFAKAFVRREQFDDRKGEPGAWLYGIARHELASYLRTLTVERRAREQLHLPDRVLSEADSEQIEAMIDFEEVGRSLQSAMAQLAPDQRVAVVFRVIDGLSYEEIAVRLDCSKDTARARVSRGLRLLAQTLTTPAPKTPGKS